MSNGRSAFQALTVEEYEAVSYIRYGFFRVIYIQNEYYDISFSIMFKFFSSFGFIYMLSSLIVISFFFFFQRELKKPAIGKEYFNRMNLEAIVTNYPYRKNLHKEDILKG